MSNLQLIEELCRIVDAFCEIVRHQSRRLAELEAFDKEERKSIDDLFDEYSKVIGSEEIPEDHFDRDESFGGDSGLRTSLLKEKQGR